MNPPKSEVLGPGNSVTHVQIHLDGITTEDGEGGQVPQSPEGKHLCEHREEISSAAMAGDAPKSHGPKSYWNQQQLLLTAFPARKATTRQHFCSKNVVSKSNHSCGGFLLEGLGAAARAGKLNVGFELGVVVLENC